ncbi:cyclase family protein [Fluviicola taffensis]|uniref:Metal-dependent hydrolase n=1 Tax=Fluviicola taffensis (strain DSM 16823 / NCIMB 13979 / RW262) TaxID=755732 RepID=F2IF92_FLUTR|nr:cyclase family protein [Fluviicola taffensis]AEA43566.1 metal-dependent hydrolase [Fluviicola taffensis DSM 16823]
MQLFLGDGSYILVNEGIDCSLPLEGSEDNVRAWYVSAPVIEPVRENGWVGAVAEGGSVNFRSIQFNPHSHGTHTECLGHITPDVHSVNGVIDKLLYRSLLVTVSPEIRMNEDGSIDRVITAKVLSELVSGFQVEALIIRTLPNDLGKMNLNYSDTNPAYCDVDILPLLDELGVLHLLIDTPSVDREKDGGILGFHHGFWGVPNQERFDRTITELVFVADEVMDGEYMLNLQTAPFVNDATPSRPLLFPLHRNAED